MLPNSVSWVGRGVQVTQFDATEQNTIFYWATALKAMKADQKRGGWTPLYYHWDVTPWESYVFADEPSNKRTLRLTCYGYWNCEAKPKETLGA